MTKIIYLKIIFLNVIKSKKNLISFNCFSEYTSSQAPSSAVSIGLHFPTLWAQTGESGVLAGGNCPPSVEQLDVYRLCRLLLNAIKSFVELTEIVVRVQLLRNSLIAFTHDFALQIPLIHP